MNFQKNRITRIEKEFRAWTGDGFEFDNPATGFNVLSRYSHENCQQMAYWNYSGEMPNKRKLYEGDIIQTNDDYILEIEYDGFKFVGIEKHNNSIVAERPLETIIENTTFWIVGNIYQGIDKHKLR